MFSSIVELLIARIGFVLKLVFRVVFDRREEGFVIKSCLRFSLSCLLTTSREPLEVLESMSLVCVDLLVFWLFLKFLEVPLDIRGDIFHLNEK